MAIRSHDIDYESDQMKLHAYAALGDVTASLKRVVFDAPYACKVESIKIRPLSTVAVGSGSFVVIQAAHADASGSLLQTHSTSGTDTTNNITASSGLTLTPTANNSLTTGRAISLDFAYTSASASITLSGVMVTVEYTPLLHREST